VEDSVGEVTMTMEPVDEGVGMDVAEVGIDSVVDEVAPS
jgi:hypothetical protein